MSFSAGYDPTPLQPKILIHDLAGTLKYTWEADQIVTTPPGTRDFSLRFVSVNSGLNDDMHSAVLIIDDPNKNLTDATTRKSSLIGRQWNIQISFGKSVSTLYRAFYGKILDVDVIRPGTNLQQLRLLCVGWGIRLHDRVTKIKRFQDKLADGETLDSTDVKAKVSELAKDILEDVDHYPDTGLGVEPSITLTGVADIDVKLADFQQNYQTWSSALSDLAAYGGAVFTLDPDRDLIFRIPGVTDSGFLFTNDLQSITTINWPQTKIGFLAASPIGWRDSTVDAGISNLIGINASTIIKDHEQNTSNSTLSAHLIWYAFPFNPQVDNVAKISPYLGKTGTPANDVTFQIVGEDGTGAPRLKDLRKAIVVAKTKLQALSASPGFLEIAFEEVAVTPREKLFFVIPKYGNVTNTFVASYQTGSPANGYYDSPTGATWTGRTGNPRMRTFSAYPADIFVENTISKNKFGLREKVIPFRNKIQQEAAREALLLVSEVIGRERRLYDPIDVNIPTDRLPLGSICRVIDSFAGLDINAEVIGINIEMSADDIGRVGAQTMRIELQEFHY